MNSIDEKRVYGDRAGATEAYVASGIGVVRVSLAGDAVGEFSLLERCVTRDIAASVNAVAVATDEDVLVRSLPGSSSNGSDDGPSDSEPEDEAGSDGFVSTGFGPSVAVGFDGDTLLAASPDGRVSHRPVAEPESNTEWASLEFQYPSESADRSASPSRSASEPAVEPGSGSEHDALEVRAIDGTFVGTAEGVYRVHDRALEFTGLSDVRDVSAAGIPLAATAGGLYSLGNGWLRAREGSFDLVATDPHSGAGRLERAHAVSGLEVYEHEEGEWLEYTQTTEAVVGIAYGETVYAVTEDGRFLAASDGSSNDTDGVWRSHSLGVDAVSGLVVPRVPESGESK